MVNIQILMQRLGHSELRIHTFHVQTLSRARYYAQGGKDLQGAVYFKSIPGIKEPGSSPTGDPDAATNSNYQSHQDPPQAQQQPQHHVQQATVYPTHEAQPASTSPHSPTHFQAPSQAYPVYGQPPYSQSGVQVNIPSGPTHPNAFGYQPAVQQQTVDELQQRFSSHNLQS